MIKVNKMISVFLAMITVTLVGCSNTPYNNSQTEVQNVSVVSDSNEVSNTLETLNNSKKITIKESSISFGKKYNIYADDTYVATVTGKVFNDFGDTFTLKDTNGDVLASESQIKRWGVKLTRGAEVRDKNNNVTGYIGEEVLTNLVKTGYYFHFYDENKNEIGTSNEIVFSAFKKNIFKDTDDNTDYVIDEVVMSLNDAYTLTVYDTSNIPVTDAILMVCIEDAIKDSEEKSK